MTEQRLVYDVGIHRGEDSAYYLKRGFRVVGIEAHPDHAGYCRTRFAREIAQGQLIVLEGAIAPPTAEPVIFYKNLENPKWGTLDPALVKRNEGRGTHHQALQVERIDLHDCFARYGMPYYMKIDIEGAEMLCVLALQDCPTRPAYLSLESEMVSFARLRHQVETLNALGYNCFRAVEQSSIPARTRGMTLPQGITHTFEYGCSGPLPEDYPDDWQDLRGILDTYRAIFADYRFFGPESWLWRSGLGRPYIAWRSKRRPGDMFWWHDLHARRAP